MRSAALWLWLCALALRLQPVLPQTVATNVPPEDQDGSGDDSDSFSGSGAGALQEISLSPPSPSTWKDTVLLTGMPTAPEPTGANPTAASTSIPPAGQGDQEGGVVFMNKVEHGVTARERTTPHPATHRASTTRATTAQTAVTSHLHRDMQPDHHQTSASEGLDQLDPHTASVGDRGPSATEGPVSQVPGEGSGEGDFTFEIPRDSTAVYPEERDQPQENKPPGEHGATGASQGLLDRKEVLGGVIAGGLVGLIFAVCLVGFMLYRMKKKDEGSYSLEEPKQANGGAYQKPSKQEEFYA